MKNIYLDANILIDYVTGRNIEKTNIKDIFQSKSNFYISPLSVHIVIYVTKMKRGGAHFQLFQKLVGKMTLIPLTDVIIKRAFKTDYKDFEDLLQYYSAETTCDTIITRDKKDFDNIKRLSKGKINIISRYKDK